MIVDLVWSSSRSSTICQMESVPIGENQIFFLDLSLPHQLLFKHDPTDFELTKDFVEVEWDNETDQKTYHT